MCHVIGILGTPFFIIIGKNGLNKDKNNISSCQP